MIEKLEVSKLQEYGFNAKAVERLTKSQEYEMYLHNDDGIYFASNVEGFIYSGPDGARKQYFRPNQITFPLKCLDLVPEYYSLREAQYLEKQRKIAGSIYDELLAQEDFKNLEIGAATEHLEHLKIQLPYDRTKKESAEKFGWYLKWLNRYDIKAANEKKKKKIDFTKVFPTKEQFLRIDIKAECEAQFDWDKQHLESMKLETISVAALFKKEIKRLEDWRDNTDPPQITWYDDTINMYPLFKRGWEMPINGDYTALNNEFKFIDEIKNQISEKYSDKEIPPQYFEKLSKVAVEEVINGAVQSKYYFWLKDQAKKHKTALNNYDNDKIDWIDIFEDIDIEKKVKPKAYITNTVEQKKNYFSEAAFKVTLELLQTFKKKVYLLSRERQLAYLEELKIEPPKMGSSGSELFDQTVFEGRSNMYEFMLNYKRALKNTLTPEETKAENEANKIDLLHVRLSAVAYFSPIEGNGVKIPMFLNCTNDQFREIAKSELNEIREAEADGNRWAPNPYKSRDIINLYKVPETSQENLLALFKDKFNEAKHYGFLTAERFAKHELNQMDLHYRKAVAWFPIFEQWKDFLKEVSEKSIVSQQPDLITMQQIEMKTKMEIKDKEAELDRIKCFNTYIDKEYNFSPTIQDFNQELAVNKRAKGENEYLVFLRETKKIYGNANHYYTIWGARGTGNDKGELYTAILKLINDELDNGLKANKEFQLAALKIEKQTLTPKPKLQNESVEVVYDILKDFFLAEDQQQLREVLGSGDKLSKRLTFLDNGNRLADAFRQLINVDLITGCNKKELEAWIGANFAYRSGSEIKEFKSRYLQDIISSNSEKCKKPILDVVKVKDGKTTIRKA
jgi:hypothetical protein